MKKIVYLVFVLVLVSKSVKCQEVSYGEKVVRLEKIKYGVEIKAHYFTLKKWDSSKRKYIIQDERFCISQLLPVDNNYKELSSSNIDVFKVEDIFELGAEYKLEFNYKDQTISFFIFPNDGVYSECITISKLEIR